jgi:hypothetical protein
MNNLLEQQAVNESDIELNANPAKEKEPIKDEVFLLINAKNKTDFQNKLKLFIKEGKIPPKFLDLSYEEYNQWKIKNNEASIHLCEQDSIIYANSYNDSRVKTDKELIDFEVWQRNLLAIAESERKKLTRGGLGNGSYNSYVALFSRRKEEECRKTNLSAIAQYKRFLPYTLENKISLAKSLVKVLYASDLEEVENNIKVIISFNQFLRLSQFGTNIDTGLATDLQFFQNTQEGGKTTAVMAHKEAMEELGLTTCVSDLTKISGIYNSESGIGTSHICYFPEETYKNELRIDFGKYEQMVKNVKNIGLNIKQGKIIPADSNACYMGGTNSTGNFGNRIYGYIIFDDGFVAREQNIVKPEELKEAWKTIFLLTPDINNIDWNIGSVNMNRRIKTDKAMTDLIKLINEVFYQEDDIINYTISYRKLQRHYFESNKNPNKYAWKKIIGELKKALSLNLISLNNDKFDNYTIITFNVDKDDFVNELLGIGKEYNYKKHYEEIVSKIYSFFGITDANINDGSESSYHSYQNTDKEVISIDKITNPLVNTPLPQTMVTMVTTVTTATNQTPPQNNEVSSKENTANNIHINPDTGKEFVLEDFYEYKEIEKENADIDKLYKDLRTMSYEEKMKLYEEKKQKNGLKIIQNDIKKDYFKKYKRIPLLTDDEKDLLYGNHIKGGTDELIGQNLSKLLFYGFCLDEIKENWKQYKAHYNHIERFGKKIQEENGFTEWLSIADYDEAVEKGNEGKIVDIKDFSQQSLEYETSDITHKGDSHRELKPKQPLPFQNEIIPTISQKEAREIIKYLCEANGLKDIRWEYTQDQLVILQNMNQLIKNGMNPKAFSIVDCLKENNMVIEVKQAQPAHKEETPLSNEECDKALEMIFGKAQ